MDNKIKLYHYSDKDIKDKIKVEYYGHNYFTANDKNITDIKRAFYYTEARPEALLRGSKFLYITEIDQSKIYDLRNDKAGYIKRFDNITDILSYIISIGYIGVIYNIGYDIVNLFYDVKFTIKKEL